MDEKLVHKIMEVIEATAEFKALYIVSSWIESDAWEGPLHEMRRAANAAMRDAQAELLGLCGLDAPAR
jgi:hypothetical protein